MHIATRPLELGIASSINLGIDRSLLVDGDLTTKAAAKTAVLADAAKLHVAERLLSVPVNAALDIIDNFQTDYTTSSDANGYSSLFGGQAATARNFWLFL